jgi:hypothetical protein
MFQLMFRVSRQRCQYSADLDRSRGDLQLDLRDESGLSHSHRAGNLYTADMTARL